MRLYYANGQEKFLLIAKTPIEGTPYSLLTVRDVTLEKKWEEEITHYTQLETLRVVASGLAHDLNNLLAAILNNVEILLVHFGYQLPSHPKEKLENIKKNCLRAKALTQQLLVYGKSLIYRGIFLNLMVKRNSGPYISRLKYRGAIYY